MHQVLHEQGMRPIKIWATDLNEETLEQTKRVASLPFVAGNGIALMPDTHLGSGCNVGSVIATDRAIIPALVGTDIGCGMVAIQLSIKADKLPDSLAAIRSDIESVIPLGDHGAHKTSPVCLPQIEIDWLNDLERRHPKIGRYLWSKATQQLGTLGQGNHFIELCVDETDSVWVMLHSGSRGIGGIIGRYFIEKAKERMNQHYINLPDVNLSYIPDNTQDFDDYIGALNWAQNYAAFNRQTMLDRVIEVLRKHISVPFEFVTNAIECHHNYVSRENHFNRNFWITRKGAIRAREKDLGIIPGSMGTKSYIVKGKGEKHSYTSASHGAGRKMSRTQARNMFTTLDLENQTRGVECRKDDSVLDEIPSSYKDLDTVMENQKDLVDIVHTLKAVLCVKGS